MYINNEISETEIREKIPFAIATRKIKYLGMNLTKEAKELFSENYRPILLINIATTTLKKIMANWIQQYTKDHIP